MRHANQRKTPEYFREEVFQLVQEAYTVLDDYCQSHQKLTFRHNDCGQEFNMTPATFLKGGRCPHCRVFIKREKKTHEAFLAEIYELVQEAYSVLTPYERSGQRLTMRHNHCGYEWNVTPSSFLRGARCPKCARLTANAEEIFKKQVKELVEDDYQLLSPVRKVSDKIHLLHKTCQHSWWVKGTSFLQGSRCPYCSKKSMKTTDTFKKELNDLVGSDYTLLTPYEGYSRKVILKHEICGIPFEVTPTHFLSGSRCPHCRTNTRLTPEKFEARVYALVGDEFSVITPYQRQQEKIWMRHNTCGGEWAVYPHNFIKSSRCPICRAQKKQKQTIPSRGLGKH